MNFNFIKLWLQALKKPSAILLIAAFLALGGCGGGSASTTSTENNLPSPVAGSIDGEVLVPGDKGKNPESPAVLELLPQVSVGQRQFADPNVLLNLRGAVVAAEGSQITKTLWTQVTGPTVTIPSPLALENIILMPDVNVATQLEFRLTAVDSEGRVNSATVSILIKPVPTFVKVVGGVFNEADELVIFKVRLNAPSTSPVTISYVTQDGTAINDGDYEFTSGEITLAAGEVIAEIPVVLTNDIVEESDESFSLQVTAIDGEASHANSGVAVIRNGAEPELEQRIQFTDQGVVTIFLKSVYANPLNPEVAAPGTGDVIYVSANPGVAIVDNQGRITPVSLGSTTITATKLADDIYLSTTAEYSLQVTTTGSIPQISMQQSDGYSVRMGDNVSLSAVVSDEEDGMLPTVAQVNESATTGDPIYSLEWVSDIDGTLGYGNSVNTNTLTQGTHRITFMVKDSDGNTNRAQIRVLVGNLSPLAGVFATSTFPGYSVNRINDTNLSVELGGAYSWVNDDEAAGEGVVRWTVYLTFNGLITVNAIDLYTSRGYALIGYTIQYWDDVQQDWLSLVTVTGNTELYRSHAVTQVTTGNLRIIGQGSAEQSTFSRINELVVFGTISTSSSSSSSSETVVR
ncbi:MAG: Calx-beta domain-containing protein [Pseudomonadota bacterium]